MLSSSKCGVESNQSQLEHTIVANSTSYLQTLDRKEAIVFVASLEKVKSHLTQELEWLNEQVQQKTVQLQGIETLLSEAVALGLPVSDALATESASEAPSPISDDTDLDDSDANDLDSDEVESDHAYNNGAASPHLEADYSTVSASAATPTSSTASKSAKSTSKQSSPRKKGDAKVKQSSTRKPGKTQAKKTASPTIGSKSRTSSGLVELRELLVPKFQGRTLTDVVSQVLESANKPVHLNDLLTEMYGDLSDRDLKRAKVSLANVLSVGKKENKWQNLGQGMYAANSVAPS